MRILLLMGMLACYISALGQYNAKSIIKTQKTKSKNTLEYTENNKHGDIIFYRNIDRDDRITMAFTYDYDSLNRKIKSLSVHSNIGYDAEEYIYENNTIKDYVHTDSATTKFPYNQEFLNKINSRKKFINLPISKELQSKNKNISTITYLNNLAQKIEENYLSDSGNITLKTYYIYNLKNKEISFRLKSPINKESNWNIYSLYDANDNKIKSFRISMPNESADTTEVYTYQYNNSNKLIAINYFYKGKFNTKTIYRYNSTNLLIEELFYQEEETILDTKTIFEYNQKGDIKRKMVYDYRNTETPKKEVYKTKTKYW